METFVGRPAKKEDPAALSETDQAAENYAHALRSLGHDPSVEMIKEFKARLDDAYTKAKAQSGGRDLSIKIVQEGAKIKVRMEPK